MSPEAPAADREPETGLLRPLWEEPPRERRRRALRILILAPYGVVMGVAFGFYGAGPLGVRAPLLSLVGVGGALVLVFGVTAGESWMRIHVGRRRMWQDLAVQVAADLVGGGILGHLLGRVLGADVLAALAGGGALMAAYSHAATWLLLDDGLESVLRLLTGQVPGEHEPDYSYAESLAVRGRVDEALAVLDEAARDRPDDPEPRLRAARLLRRNGRLRDALVRYERALEMPEIGPGPAVGAALQVREICLGELDDRAAARPAMRILVDRFPDAPPAEWMREELEETEAGR